jgi:hypothetical protein
MTQDILHIPERRRAACEIENAVKRIAFYGTDMRATCVWNLGQEMDHTGPHRLDVSVGELACRLYFTDGELLDYNTGDSVQEVDFRLDVVLSKLFAH